MNKVLPIIRQENNTKKRFFFFFYSSFLLDQDNIYRDAKLPHCQKKKIALQNMKTQNKESDC